MSRVLIIDNDEKKLCLLETLLQGNGYTVFMSKHGDEAINLAHSELPDVVVSDIQIPVIEGFSVCRYWGPLWCVFGQFNSFSEGIPYGFILFRLAIVAMPAGKTNAA